MSSDLGVFEKKNKHMPNLVIISPIFNEQDGLETFLLNLSEAVRPFVGKLEIHFCGVNNGSTDESLNTLKKFQSKEVIVSYLTLTRNFGYEAAFESGLRTISADYYVLMDADGEDPVTLLPKFYEGILCGFEIVYGIRVKRQESRALQLMRRLFYKIIYQLADDPFWQNVGEFSMFSREVRNCILKETNSHPFWRASLARSGFPSRGIPHTRNSRIAGKSKLNARRMFTFGIAGLLSSTTSPLRLNAYFLTTFTLLFIPIFLLQSLTEFNPDFMWIIFSTFLGITAYAISTISIYIARLYKNSLNRPNFYINWKDSRVDERIFKPDFDFDRRQ
jgi:glycosyltransferase involved in cell wall biosynthesis